MTNFNPKGGFKDIDLWSSIAEKKAGKTGAASRIIAGILLGGLGVSMGAEILGGVVAAWLLKSAWQALELAGKRLKVVRDMGCNAFVLSEDEFRVYVQQFGDKAVLEELIYAESQGCELSKFAGNWLYTHGENLNTTVVLDVSPMKLEVNATPESLVPSKFTTSTVEYGVDNNIDIVDQMSHRVSNSFILGIGGSGKGVLISNALRAIKKKHPDIKIFYVDPKCHEKEFGYVEGVADVIKRYKCETEEPKIVVGWLKKCLEDFDKYAESNERTLLVLDEGTVLGLKSKLAKSSLLLDRLSSLTSLGDSAGKNIYFVAQTPFVGGSGIDLSASSQLVTVALVSDENRGSLSQWKRSAMFEKCDNLDAFIDNSPIKRAVYFGKTRKWYSMPKLVNYSGYDRDNRVMIDNDDSIQPQENITTIQQLETIYNKPDSTNNLSATAQTILDIILSSSKGYSTFEAIRKSRKWNDSVPPTEHIKIAIQQLVKLDIVEPLDGGEYKIK